MDWPPALYASYLWVYNKREIFKSKQGASTVYTVHDYSVMVSGCHCMTTLQINRTFSAPLCQFQNLPSDLSMDNVYFCCQLIY